MWPPTASFREASKNLPFFEASLFGVQLTFRQRIFFSWSNKKGAADPKTGYAVQIFHAKFLVQIDEKNPWRPLKDFSGCQGANMVY
jgi:hypothetical protein